MKHEYVFIVFIAATICPVRQFKNEQWAIYHKQMMISKNAQNISRIRKSEQQ